MCYRSAARKAAKSNASCFACAILTHGDEGILYGTDGGPVRIDHMVKRVCRIPGLVGKPKLFFLQVTYANTKFTITCTSVAWKKGDDNMLNVLKSVYSFLSLFCHWQAERGFGIDKGVATHAEDKARDNLPCTADVLVCSSSAAGMIFSYPSSVILVVLTLFQWASSNHFPVINCLSIDVFVGNISLRSPVTGGLFVNAIEDAFTKHGKEEDVLSLMTRVSDVVSMQAFCLRDPFVAACVKQMPVFESSLRKTLYLCQRSRIEWKSADTLWHWNKSVEYWQKLFNHDCKFCNMSSIRLWLDHF